MSINNIKYDINETTFYNNLLYLFKLNRQKNNKKKLDLFREANISRSSEKNWQQGSIPARTTLRRIAEYFNKWLGIHINPDILLNDNIRQSLLAASVVREPENLSPEQVQFLELYDQLTAADQKIVQLFMERLKKGP